MILHSKRLKPYRPYLLSVSLSLIAFAAIMFVSTKKPVYQVSAGSCVFKADGALTVRSQYEGLSSRKSLDVDKGMLFLFATPADQTFVMRSMNFPLDIIFIRDNRVVNLYQNLPPEGAVTKMSYHSGAPVNAVLEVPAGRSRACGIGVGTQVKW